ncbi:MAG: UDP-N-acetylglucosamine--N-acetylmuramyl-(pentapeptide) pyrophosphoryl-undecaprenol N-acetylglucosamine transferase [Nitrospirales bacterium]|nr:MAG: UDP-N-acetylglucosamine--N-acetylmuramyl-(pentapeptide) pyrophosphoryl-undecaprenol N-acetylglucosamine transferase [Nitrospirales bacterium]
MTRGLQVPKNIVIAAGGTGGHLYPAIALAKEFTRQVPETMITFVGSGKHLENSILAHEGFVVEHIDVKGIVGLGVWGGLRSVLLLPKAIRQSMKILRARSADLVIGTGGYFSPPVVCAAALLGVRRIVMEPNAVPGLANRVLGPIADRVFVAFDSAKDHFNRTKVRMVGTPVREEFFHADAPKPDHRKKTVLVVGGSQGAKAINTAVADALQTSSVLRETCAVIHQTGASDYERVRSLYGNSEGDVDVVPFLYDMPQALKSVDLVVSRSGAGTLAELAACGKPSILIPFPYATHGHQEKNARAMEATGAASVILESELTGERLAYELEMLLSHPERLHDMSLQSLACRQVDATRLMIQECQDLMRSMA